jgi:rhodanese-related sulfurtransferase
MNDYRGIGHRRHPQPTGKPHKLRLQWRGYAKEVFWQDKKFVFHHALGWRSALTVAGLRQMGFEAAHLQEGFKTWAEVTGSVDPTAVWPLA